MSFLVFDIETRVDKAMVRATQCRDETVSEQDAYEQMRRQLRREAAGRGEFFPLTYHVPISVGLGAVGSDYVLTDVDVLRAEVCGEEALVQTFWKKLEQFDGQLVSFNGRRFDLPVLELQALKYGCVLPRYFNQRDGFRARFGRHYDLYDFLSNNGAVGLRGGFDLLSKLVGLPGKGAVSGRDVQELWEAERFADIHRYCAEDVIQTYFLFVHLEHARGRFGTGRLRQIEQATQAFRSSLSASQPADGEG